MQPATQAQTGTESTIDRAVDGSAMSMPPHTQTQSTLAPTAEFTRIFLLAWIIRYIFRGASGAAFEDVVKGDSLRAKILNALSAPGRIAQRGLPKWMGGGKDLVELEAATYSIAIGAGSSWLSMRYGAMVKNDIQNIFREAVAYENDVPQENITFGNIKNSDNKIVRRTVDNYRSKMWERIGTDALFFLAAPLRSSHITDTLLGVKGVQIFADTWKRKTTMFEDLVSFINNKINPRNGLGQPIGMGEVFDLYQHYAEAFHLERMFNNVVEHGTGEGARWAASRPIFQHITELMNQTYAYKHNAVLDASGHAVHSADFPLPKFIYLLGHDMIDVTKPEQTLALIELADKRGIPAVKQARAFFEQGRTPQEICKQFGITLPQQETKKAESEKNAVLPKGSTMQLDAAPTMKIDAASIAHEPPQAERVLA